MFVFAMSALGLFALYRVITEYWPWLLAGVGVAGFVFVVVPTIAHNMPAPAVARGSGWFFAGLTATLLTAYLLVSTGSWLAPVVFVLACLAIVLVVELVIPTVVFNLGEQSRRRRRPAPRRGPAQQPVAWLDAPRVPQQRPPAPLQPVEVADDLDALGWDTWAAVTPLTVIDEQDDPGNPGETIVLYAIPAHLYGTESRVVCVTDASPSRDGVKHRYGLPVPSHFVDAVEAVASTWGVTRAAYSGLVKGT